MSNFLSEMREFLARELKARSVESQAADDISEDIAVHFRQSYGGIPIYIQKKSNDYSERNAEIYRKFNGRNTLQLCREYDLCYQHICKIIKEQRDKKQSVLLMKKRLLSFNRCICTSRHCWCYSAFHRLKHRLPSACKCQSYQHPHRYLPAICWTECNGH